MFTIRLICIIHKIMDARDSRNNSCNSCAPCYVHTARMSRDIEEKRSHADCRVSVVAKNRIECAGSLLRTRNIEIRKAARSLDVGLSWKLNCSSRVSDTFGFQEELHYISVFRQRKFLKDALKTSRTDPERVKRLLDA